MMCFLYASLSDEPAILQDVLHVPRITANLISIYQIKRQGYGVYFDSYILEVSSREIIAKKTKFESKTKKCKILGYSTHYKVYKFWDLESNSLIISRDINFVELKLDNPRILLDFTIEIPLLQNLIF